MGVDPAGAFRGGGSMIVAGIISLIVGAWMLWIARKSDDIDVLLWLMFGCIFAGAGIALIANSDSSESDRRPIIITCEEPGIHDLRTGYSESLTVICP